MLFVLANLIMVFCICIHNNMRLLPNSTQSSLLTLAGVSMLLHARPEIHRLLFAAMLNYAR